MCVILVCPKKVRPDRATLDACHSANPHGEIVIHFRWASVGEVTPKLCHPFPVTACATTRLSGHARAVLFHNGTWCQWRETLKRMPKHRLPDGLLSDSRVAASLVDLCGIEALERLPGRYVVFDRDFTELFGDWQRWRGMQVSNLGFTHHLSKPRSFAPKCAQIADSHYQRLLDFPDTCGNPDL